MLRSTLTLALVLAVGCGTKKEEHQAPPASPANPAAEQEAQSVFHNLCITCHGESGKGDGIAAANLDPKPRNYTDKAWQASVTDDQIRQIILNGGASVGKSPVMPASPQLKDKPEVVDALVKIVRSFGA